MALMSFAGCGYERTPSGWDAESANNLRVLRFELEVVLDDNTPLRQELFASVEAGDSALSWLARQGWLKQHYFVCPGKRSEGPSSGKILAKGIPEGSIDYETWPWTNRTFPALKKLGMRTPVVWEKHPDPLGRRMIVSSVGVEVIDDKEFENRMEPFRERVGNSVGDP